MISQLLSLTVGTAVIRFLHRVRRKLSGTPSYFSFSDFLVEEQRIQERGFIWMTLPPITGGILLSFWPGADSSIAAAAGFMAAFLGVWPVFQFPYELLDEYLQPYWHKLKYLYLIFVGTSAALAYLGFLLRLHLAPLAQGVTRTHAWQAFLDNLAANAMYDVLKYVVVTLLVLGGIYVNKRRQTIGIAAGEAREAGWVKEAAEAATEADE
jgi:hypothetical protein